VRQGRFYEFTVQYSPAELINQATIDDDNIVITSRRGLHERAKVFTFSTAGDFIKVIYRINIRKLNIRDQTAMLNIDMRADQVLDSLGDAVAPGLLAQFQAGLE
jgi:hypothetical protein